MGCIQVLLCCFQVVETVRIFVTDANDEAPEFQNLPFVVDVSEVRDNFIYSQHVT